MSAPELPPLPAYFFNWHSGEYQAHQSGDYDKPECYMAADVDAHLAALHAELERLRRHLASAQADRAEEYRQREAWRAKAGQLEEVLKRIAEKKLPDSLYDWRPWHDWAEEVQDLASEWAPEEEG